MRSAKILSKARDLGDHQTPAELVRQIFQALGPVRGQWTRVLEPTCGAGNFITAVLEASCEDMEIHGIEIQQAHVRTLRGRLREWPYARITIHEADVFTMDLGEDLAWTHQGPLLVVGNPPWITNAELGLLGSANLPPKNRSVGLRGLEAVTGQANFDLGEYVWIKVLSELSHENPRVAMLCKTAVARRVLTFARDARIPLKEAAMWRIDTRRWFQAGVDACLFSVQVGPSSEPLEISVYSDLQACTPDTVMGFRDGNLVPDIRRFEGCGPCDGACALDWRQGVKHNLAAVMELRRSGGKLVNGFGDPVSVEDDYLYPLLKSTDLFHGRTADPQRVVVIPQRHPGEDTRSLQTKAPRLWEYLSAHAERFHQRKSAIFRTGPPFGLFGIGPYSFAPFKVAVSGLHKIPRFRVVSPVHGRPVMLDDTCYFVACETSAQALALAEALNHPQTIQFLTSVIFADAKRPITKRLLQRIDMQSGSSTVRAEVSRFH